jgi:hypothetical protein
MIFNLEIGFSEEKNNSFYSHCRTKNAITNQACGIMQPNLDEFFGQFSENTAARKGGGSRPSF